MKIWERAVEAQWRRGEDQRETVCLHADKQLYSGMFDEMMEKFREGREFHWVFVEQKKQMTGCWRLCLMGKPAGFYVDI